MVGVYPGWCMDGREGRASIESDPASEVIPDSNTNSSSNSILVLVLTRVLTRVLTLGPDSGS